MKKQQKNLKLSIIILTYNVEKVIAACLNSVLACLEKDWEVIVIDNNSTDATLQIIKSAPYENFIIIENKENSGFAEGNNLAVKKARGEYVLFLNPDTVVEKNSIKFGLEYLENNSNVGAATVKVLLGDGKLDYSCHRGFPTPWNSLCWFSGLSKLFPNSKLLNGYSMNYLDFSKAHEVDSITGAFFMMPKVIGEKLKWFDTDFFWNGEDLDLCFRIKELGLKIMYLPQEKIWHYKGASGGHKRASKTFYARFEVMKLFYDKHYRKNYPEFVRWLVFFGINIRLALQWLLG